MTSGQKSRITKLAQEYGHFLRHPELFHAPHVGKQSARDLKASGYKVTPKGRAIIPLHEFQSAEVKRGQIVFKSGRMKETVHLVGHKTFYQKLRALSQKALGRDEMLTVQIGANSPFKRSRFTSYWELYRYIQEHFQPKDEGESKEALIARMSVVHVYSPRKAQSRAKKATARKRGH